MKRAVHWRHRAMKIARAPMQRTKAPAGYEELIRVIHDSYTDMSNAYQKIALYLTQNPNEVAVHSVNAIGRRCGVHASSLVRFAQALGYDGFKSLQQVFQRRLATAAPGFEARIKALKSELGSRNHPRGGELFRELG